MPPPPEHAELLKRTNYPVPPTAVLTDAERTTLARYGYWLEALASGAIAPLSQEQEQFVRVANGEDRPHSPFEIAWAKSHRPHPRELAAKLNRLLAARSAALAAQGEYSSRRAAIMEQVREQLEAVDAEFSERLTAAGENVSRLETEVKLAVLAYGATFAQPGALVSYVKGARTWDTKKLNQHLETHPELGEFRKVGDPHVRIKYDSPDQTNQDVRDAVERDE